MGKVGAVMKRGYEMVRQSHSRTHHHTFTVTIEKETDILKLVQHDVLPKIVFSCHDDGLSCSFLSYK